MSKTPKFHKFCAEYYLFSALSNLIIYCVERARRETKIRKIEEYLHYAQNHLDIMQKKLGDIKENLKKREETNV